MAANRTKRKLSPILQRQVPTTPNSNKSSLPNVHFTSILQDEFEQSDDETDENFVFRSMPTSPVPPNHDFGRTVSVEVLEKVLPPEELQHVIKLQKDEDDNTGILKSPSIPPFSPQGFPNVVFRFDDLQKKGAKISRTRNLKPIAKIRECLAHLQRGESPKDIYMKCVKDGRTQEVRAILQIASNDRSLQLDKNCVDFSNKSALRIAVDKRYENLIRLLIDYNIDIGDSFFHAIKQGYLEAVEIFVEKKPSLCRNMVIQDENQYFMRGLTPMICAAVNNQYKILKFLYCKEFKIENEQVITSYRKQGPYEQSTHQRLVWRVKASPAYITLLNEVERVDPMQYCMELVELLRKYKTKDPSFYDVYDSLIYQVETYMCNLLDQISSTEELCTLFNFNCVKTEVNTDQKHKGRKYTHIAIGGLTSGWVIRNRLKILEEAAGKKLFRFVTHHQSQLALSHLCNRYMPKCFENNSYISMIMLFFLSVIYPILSVFYLVAPSSKFGRLLTVPIVSVCCHFASDIYFVAWILMSISTKTATNDTAGELPSAYEWLIVLWVFSKCLQELQEIMNRGPKGYFLDMWCYNDILMLILFLLVIVIRAFEYFSFGVESGRSYRKKCEIILSWAYLLTFIRILERTRVSRWLGPLLISLIHMIKDVTRFLGLFFIIHFAFSLSFTGIFWYYGTTEGKQMICRTNPDVRNNNFTDCVNAEPHVLFTTEGSTLKQLFWALFNMIDKRRLVTTREDDDATLFGNSLLAVYHVVSILVLLNMIIAMMSRSYDMLSENEDQQWQFHRTAVWIRFVRREVVRPAPMNLFPNIWKMFGFCKRFFYISYVEKRARKRDSQTPSEKNNYYSTDNATLAENKRENKEHTSIKVDNQTMPYFNLGINLKETLLLRVVENLVRRYKFNHLIERNNKK